MRPLYEMEVRFTLSFKGKDRQKALLSIVPEIHSRLMALKQTDGSWAKSLKTDVPTCNPQVNMSLPTPTDPTATDQPFELTISGTLVYPGATDHDVRFDHKQELANFADALCAELGLEPKGFSFEAKVMDPMITFLYLDHTKQTD